jgi:hypothetical protein
MAKATTIEIRKYKQKEKEEKRSKWVAKTLIVVDVQFKGPLKVNKGNVHASLVTRLQVEMQGISFITTL